MPHQPVLTLIMEGADERAWALLASGLTTEDAAAKGAQRKAELIV